MFQTVMRNKNLSPEAKAIYAYLCSFAGNKETCHPSVNIMSQFWLWESGEESVSGSERALVPL